MTSTAVLMASLRSAAIAPLGLVRRQAIFRRRKPRGVGKSAASSPAGRSRVAHNDGAHEKNRVLGLPSGRATHERHTWAGFGGLSGFVPTTRRTALRRWNPR